jgi:pSer/pThr/pTyr-binding forkhead associated (FHA) protein
MRLEAISGNAAGTTILVEDELVIGRHAEGAGRLSEDEEISRQHARISREATGDYAIEDLGSSNGTFVNGLRINSPRLLSLGDSIETGATTLVVREIVQPRAGATVVSAVPDLAAPAPPLKLELEVDFEARRAKIALGDDGDTVDLAFEDGRWRARPAEPGSAGS